MSDFPKFLKIATTAKNFPYIGKAFISLLSQGLKFSYEVIHPKDGHYGNLIDGNWTGLVGMVLRKECDLAVDMLTITEDRNNAVSFSFPFEFSDMTFLTNKPVALSKRFAVIHLFSYQVWIAIIFTTFCMSVAFSKVFIKHENFSTALVATFGSLLGESLDFKVKTLSKKFLVLFWMIGVFFVSNFFKALLLSVLTFPPLEGVRNIAELSKAVSKGTHEVFTLQGSFMESVLLQSSDASLRIIGKSMASKPNFKYSDINDYFKNHRGAYISTRQQIELHKERNFVSDDSFLLLNSACAVNRTFCCKHKLDLMILRIIETGLFQKIWIDVRLPKTIEMMREDDQLVNALYLDDVAGAFIFLAVGYLLAFITLIVEMAFKRYL